MQISMEMSNLTHTNGENVDGNIWLLFYYPKKKTLYGRCAGDWVVIKILITGTPSGNVWWWIISGQKYINIRNFFFYIKYHFRSGFETSPEDYNISVQDYSIKSIMLHHTEISWHKYFVWVLYSIIFLLFFSCTEYQGTITFFLNKWQNVEQIAVITEVKTFSPCKRLRHFWRTMGLMDDMWIQQICAMGRVKFTRGLIFINILEFSNVL